MPKLVRVARISLIGLIFFLSLATAQEEVPQADDAPLVPADEYNRGTPKGTGAGFMLAIDAGDYVAAAEYLDLRNLRGEASELTGEQLARRFFVIAKRASWIELDEPSDSPEGRLNDGLPDYRDSIGVVLNDGNEVRLMMQKVPRGDGVSIWKISNASVSQIPTLYETYGYPDFVEDLRRALPNKVILGYELFKWVLLLTSGAIAYSIIFLIALAVRRLLGDSDSPSHRKIFRFLIFPVGVWVVLLTLSTGAMSLGRGVTAEYFHQVTPIPIVITVWVLYAGINLLRDIMSDRLREAERPGTAVLLQPASNALKMLIAAAAILVYLDKLGVNITTVLAGLGVGGIAVALALQKPMEDVFGAITLYSQQPIRVGDFCKVGSETGTIEEIGLRTTRIRTLADTLIAVPNSVLATEPIDNISARKKIRYRPVLRLRYDTTPEQIQQVLDGIRDMFSAYDDMLKDSQRVRFFEIGDDALLIEANGYLNTTDWARYLELAEDLNLKILDIVNRAGTKLALPARQLHVEQHSDGLTGV